MQYKFRVWNSIDNKMIDNDSLIKELIAITLPDDKKNYIPMINFITIVPECGFFLQQFIGVKDKSGQEIYSGDIINFTLKGITHGPESEDIKNAEVWYSEEDAMFRFGKFKDSNNQEYSYDTSDRIDRTSIKIIGNIFETPKLCKEN